MFIADHARDTPDKPALILAGTGRSVSYRELDDASNRLARCLHAAGLRRGDGIALMLENHHRFPEVVWAAMRSGLYVTAINRHMTAEEAAYVARDCDARVLVSSAALAPVAARLPAMLPGVERFLILDGALPGWEALDDAVAPFPAEPLAKQWLGSTMLYSSGTTGRPKGVRWPLGDAEVGETFRSLETAAHYGFDRDTVYLGPAPLYHAAPLGHVLLVQRAGGTAVVMPRFDAAEALRLIARHRVTHSQWVPTMFVRMLKLDPAERDGHDLSSHRCAVHAAAPCPPDTKRAMIAWWGPILHEYYAGSESNGMTRIDSAEWLERPGSVGRATVGTIHICDDEGRELPAGESGLVFFERDTMPFSYHKDPAKTDAARHPVHREWSTLGDVGFLDEDGFLFLTDRKAFMIISGGVNIYPRMVEDAIIDHPAVRDVAVLGVPSEEMGEDVKAVVELMDDHEPTEALAEELRAHAAARVARYMVPRSVDFLPELPRTPTGKLLKRALRQRYWPETGAMTGKGA